MIIMLILSIGIEVEQSKSVEREKLFRSSEVRDKVKRLSKEINDWAFAFQS